MNICFVTREYPPETGYGGIATYYADVAQALVARGHQAVVISQALGAESFSENQGVAVYRITPYTMRGLWRVKQYWTGYRLRVALKLAEVVHHHQIDLIETPELWAEPFLYYAFNPMARPLIVRLHSGTALGLKYNDAPLIPRFRINRQLEKWLLYYARLITAPTQALVDESLDLGMPLSLAKTHIIPNPVDVELFRPNPAIERRSDEILFVGRIEWWKGVDILVNAIPEMISQSPDLQFTFIGATGSPTNEIFRQQLQSSIPPQAQVQFLPPVPRHELPVYYQRATLVVVPSRWEAFGYVAAEAMACGTPVVAHQRGGLAEITLSELQIASEDPHIWATCLLTILANSAKYSHLGAIARQHIVEHYALPKITSQLIETYESVLA
jgi:glycosyltransferase involved in cell wall biosynthesis